jgi:hypothetical protein
MLKNTMYRPSCIGWLRQWAPPVDDGYKDQILPPLPIKSTSCTHSKQLNFSGCDQNVPKNPKVVQIFPKELRAR